MINEDKWVSSLPKINTRFNETTNHLDHNRWTDTISKEKSNNVSKKYSIRK